MRKCTKQVLPALLTVAFLAMPGWAEGKTTVKVFSAKNGQFSKPVGSVRNLRPNGVSISGRFVARNTPGHADRVVLAKKPGKVTIGVFQVLAVPIQPGQSYRATASRLIGRTDPVAKGSDMRWLLFLPDGVDMKVSVGPKGTKSKNWTSYKAAFLGL